MICGLDLNVCFLYFIVRDFILPRSGPFVLSPCTFNVCVLHFRDLLEIKESERRAHSQADMFKNALDEHSLELRVKAANEAEAACQQRLAATEAEITESRDKLDASERCFFLV